MKLNLSSQHKIIFNFFFIIKMNKLILDSNNLIKRNNEFFINQNDFIINFQSLKLSQVIIHRTFYNVSSELNNNVLNIDTISITIPDGMYNINSLTTYLDAQLKILDPNFTFTFDILTKKINITNTVNFTINFTLSTIGKLLGFPQSGSVISSDYTPTYFYNLLAFKYINLHFNGITENIFKNNTNKINIIGIIPNNGLDIINVKNDELNQNILNITNLFNGFYFTSDSYPQKIDIRDFVLIFDT